MQGPASTLTRLQPSRLFAAGRFVRHAAAAGRRACFEGAYHLQHLHGSALDQLAAGVAVSALAAAITPALHMRAVLLEYGHERGVCRRRQPGGSARQPVVAEQAASLQATIAAKRIAFRRRLCGWWRIRWRARRATVVALGARKQQRGRLVTGTAPKALFGLPSTKDGACE